MRSDRKSWHFGVLPFTGTGHLNPFISLAKELEHRGHTVTFFEKPKIGDRVRYAGLKFFPIYGNDNCKQKQPPLSVPKIWSDIVTLRFNLKRIAGDIEIFLQQTPTALKQAGVDALLINEVALTGPTVAQLLGLPYFLISTSVPHSFGWNAFPLLSGYRHSSSPISWIENALLEVSALRVRGPIERALNVYRKQAALGPVRKIRRVFPELAQITQLPSCLDLPNPKLPGNFYYTGPFVNKTARPPIEFPWDRIDGRPIIYASLGTTRTVQPSIFRLIAAACQEFNLQLVISLGGRFELELFDSLPGGPLVTKYAPQLELLKVAKIVISHGGSNSVFETLMEGRPMIVIPLAHDQPAIAARLARLKIAEVLPVMKLSAAKIGAAITKLLNDALYTDAALNMQARLRSFDGSECAAKIIEENMERHVNNLRGIKPNRHKLIGSSMAL
jgi:zeaxanthin glucosyltransferase